MSGSKVRGGACFRKGPIDWCMNCHILSVVKIILTFYLVSAPPNGQKQTKISSQLDMTIHTPTESPVVIKVLKPKVNIPHNRIRLIFGSSLYRSHTILRLLFFIYCLVVLLCFINISEEPAYSTSDGSNFYFFSGRYVRETMCNSVFF